MEEGRPEKEKKNAGEHEEECRRCGRWAVSGGSVGYGTVTVWVWLGAYRLAGREKSPGLASNNRSIDVLFLDRSTSSLFFFLLFLFLFPSSVHYGPGQSAGSRQESLLQRPRYVAQIVLSPTNLTIQTPPSSPSILPPCSRYVLFAGMPILSCFSPSWLYLYLVLHHISAVRCVFPSHRSFWLASLVL